MTSESSTMLYRSLHNIIERSVFPPLISYLYKLVTIWELEFSLINLHPMWCVYIMINYLPSPQEAHVYNMTSLPCVGHF